MKRISVKKALYVLFILTLYLAVAALYMAFSSSGRSALFGLLAGYVLWDLLSKANSLRKE